MKNGKKHKQQKLDYLFEVKVFRNLQGHNRLSGLIESFNEVVTAYQNGHNRQAQGMLIFIMPIASYARQREIVEEQMQRLGNDSNII